MHPSISKRGQFLATISLVLISSFSACDAKVKNVDSCGDGVLDPGEECDGDQLSALDCAALGYHEQVGVLTCRGDCMFDLSVCTGGRCGDGAIQRSYEDCEQENLGGATCESEGLGGGSLACASDCNFDTTGCEAFAVCGDGIISTPHEECDGDDLAGASCVTLGYHAGELTCTTDDCRFDREPCEAHGRCGDGIIQTMYAEVCDGAAMAGQDCGTLGYYGGTLLCADDCAHDLSGCEPHGRCGDGVIQEAHEACDGSTFPAGVTCQNEGYHPGVLSCDACELDLSGCDGACGDGVLQEAFESCDGMELGTSVCRDLQLFFGSPVCGAACTPEAGTCTDAYTWGAGAGTASLAYGVATDTTGNVLVTGTTNGSLDGQSHVGGKDIFLTKFGADGTRLWTRQYGTPGDERVYAVAVDAAGNIFLTGSTYGALDGQANAGDWDIFLSKFDAAGNRLWTKLWGTGGSNADNGEDVAVDAAGNIYVTGSTAGALDGQTFQGGHDIFLSKFDTSGTRLWTRQWGTAGQDMGTGLTVGSTGDVFIAGHTFGALNGQTHAGEYDAFLMRVTNVGVHVWTRQWGTGAADFPGAAAVDAAGNLFVIGNTRGALDGQTLIGQVDIFLTKFDASGTRLWTRQWGTAFEDWGDGVAVSSAGDVYVSGYTQGSLEGQSHNGLGDAFLTRLDASGTRLWTRQWGTAFEDEGNGVALDAAGHAFVAGLWGFPGGSDAFLKYFH